MQRRGLEAVWLRKVPTTSFELQNLSKQQAEPQHPEDLSRLLWRAMREPKTPERQSPQELDRAMKKAARGEDVLVEEEVGFG